ncbi:MAG TPA: nitroreductase family protein [Acidimicrobiia bacterium]|jgi:nitroreductase
MKNDIYRQILGLRAIRSFRPDPLADEHLEAILEAGRWTGSAKNAQNWSFIVVDEPGQREALAGCGDFMTPVRHAPLTIALVQEPDGYELDTGRLAQNMMLAASTVGVASCPVTLHRDGDAAAVLGLPAGRRCRYAIAFGYPSKGTEPRPLGGRKPLAELVHRNRYGTSSNRA